MWAMFFERRPVRLDVRAACRQRARRLFELVWLYAVPGAQ